MNDKNKRSAKIKYLISVNTTEQIIVLSVADIVRLEAHSNYTFIFLTNEKRILSSKNLKEFEQVLTAYDFLRIHKSHLVNTAYISHLTKKGNGLLHLKNSSKLQVSDAGREKFLKFFKKNCINV